MTKHRIPPKPDYFNTVLPGTCRWCNTGISLTPTGRESKAKWHADCLTEYLLVTRPSNSRRAVWRRDSGLCNTCGAVCSKKGENKWQMDHIIPLINANGELKYWMLGNLQTLCNSCHNVKTALEAGDRARKRKEKKSE
jgi:5-methylcytosine-specific restriction endonuclease McrA